MGKSEAKASRRRFLRWVFFGAIGIAVPLAGESLAKVAFTVSPAAVGMQTPSAIFTTEGTEATFLRIKVEYFQMGQYVNLSEEYFSIQSPASVRDLATAVMMRHPSISSQMMNTMLILVNGTPAKASTSLKDNDEVDLIPLVAGG